VSVREGLVFIEEMGFFFFWCNGWNILGGFYLENGKLNFGNLKFEFYLFWNLRGKILFKLFFIYLIK